MLDAIDPHVDRVAWIHRSAARARVEMSGHGQALAVRLLDERLQLLGPNALCLEAHRTARRPLIDFLLDPLRRLLGRIPLRPRRAEVWSRAQNARADLLAALDASPRAHH